MKILVCSYAFYPNIGGIETVSQLLVKQWYRLGHGVSVVTDTPGPHDWEGIPVHRKPSFSQLRYLLNHHDVCWHNNISLRYILPLFVVPRPWFVTSQLWPTLTTLPSWHTRLKTFSQFFAHNIYISSVVSDHFPWRGPIIPNPVDLSGWLPDDRESPRDLDLVFVGRLVGGKGCDLLVDALNLLQQSGVFASLTIIGDGPDRPALEKSVKECGLDECITFTGFLQGRELARLVRKHRFFVIPSTWEEPFGVVALEAIAAGCVPIISCRGGLKEAAGQCGVVIGNLEPEGVADVIYHAMCNYDHLKDKLQAHAEAHLLSHSVASIAERYLQLFKARAHRSQ